MSNLGSKYWVNDLELINYRGYQHGVFDFTNGKGTVNPISVFYGPNGCGKSTCLEALNMLGNSQMFFGRDNDLQFRKMIYHPDYDPSLPHFIKHKLDMTLRATFCDEEGNPFLAEISSNGVGEGKKIDGIINMEIPGRDVVGWIDADHAMNMNKFQIPSDRISQFLRMAKIVYGYPCDIDAKVVTTLGGTSTSNTATQSKARSITYFQDFIIDKGDTRVHFKSMSAGEKKIATLLRNLCNPLVVDKPGVILIDNVEMHIYFKRHAKVIDQLLLEFPEKQFIVTTHSQLVIEHVGKTYGSRCLFDITKIKGQTMIED